MCIETHFPFSFHQYLRGGSALDFFILIKEVLEVAEMALDKLKVLDSSLTSLKTCDD